MSNDPDELPAIITQVTDKLDLAISLIGANPLITPALAILVGRRVVNEAGRREALDEGLDIACAMLRRAALVEAKKLWGEQARD